jgi:hypothetical protein
MQIIVKKIWHRDAHRIGLFFKYDSATISQIKQLTMFLQDSQFMVSIKNNFSCNKTRREKPPLYTHMFQKWLLIK